MNDSPSNREENYPSRPNKSLERPLETAEIA